METRRKMRLEDIDALKTLLQEIWALGDRDEMSVKHIGHGLAAIATWGDWRDGLDYDQPGIDMSESQLETLAELWQQVGEWLHGVSREEQISVFEHLPIAQYGAIYLDTFSDYYRQETKL